MLKLHVCQSLPVEVRCTDGRTKGIHWPPKTKHRRKFCVEVGLDLGVQDYQESAVPSGPAFLCVDLGVSKIPTTEYLLG